MCFQTLIACKACAALICNPRWVLPCCELHRVQRKRASATEGTLGSSFAVLRHGMLLNQCSLWLNPLSLHLHVQTRFRKPKPLWSRVEALPLPKLCPKPSTLNPLSSCCSCQVRSDRTGSIFGSTPQANRVLLKEGQQL